MNGCRARWITLACFVLAASLLYSCSDDTTCPVVTTCPNPGKALLGTWVIFESWMGGSPQPVFLGTELEFRADDTVTVRAATDTLLYSWMADDSLVVLEYTGDREEIIVFAYEFEADTLNMEDKLSGLDVYWRLHKK